MTIGLISFTGRGYALEKSLIKKLRRDGMDVIAAVKCEFLEPFEESEEIEKVEEVSRWVEQTLQRAEAFVFIGACGIAVRCMARFLQDKRTDPAVVVIDEWGKYCIPILSGHLGGANALSDRLSRYLGAENVITTATDLNQTFAVDLFAKKNHLGITNKELAKKVSASLLAGKKVLFYCEGAVKGSIPEGLLQAPEGQGLGICISLRSDGKPPFTETLYLKPQAVILGIGCKKNTPLEKIQETVREAMELQHMPMDVVKGVASIDLKKEEKGIVDFCSKEQILLQTFSAEELQEVQGTFQTSSFVEAVTGVDNVCERSAVRACEKGSLLQGKYAKDGVTVAIAVSDWSVSFE